MNLQPKVFLVDDDPGVCQSLCAVLRTVDLPVQTFKSGKDFLDRFDPAQPGYLILDLRMPGMSGLDVQEQLLLRKATLPIIFISAHGEVNCAVRAIKAGAVDFLEKPFRGQELLDRVQRALQLDARQRAEDAQNRKLATQIESLSRGERAVLDLMVAGQPYKVIAAKLDISYKTVEARRTRIMKKLEADSLPELMHRVITFRQRHG